MERSLYIDTCCWDSLSIVDADSCSDDIDCIACVPMECLNQGHPPLLSNDDLLSNNEVQVFFPGGVMDGFYTCRVFSRGMLTEMPPPCSVYYVSLTYLRIQAGICSNQYPEYLNKCEHENICEQEVS